MSHRRKVLPESMSLVSVEGRESRMLERGVSCIADTQTTALESLLAGDARSLLDACNEPDFAPNHEYTSHRSKTLLHLAVEKNDITAINILLETGADVNQPNRLTKQTAFHAALKLCEPEVLRLLLFRSKVNINAETADGGSALHVLVSKCLSNDKALKCLALLLRCSDLNIEKKDNKGGRTALAILAQMHADGPTERIRLVTALRLLVRKGADLDALIDGQRAREVLRGKLSKSEFDRVLNDESNEFVLLSTSLASTVKEELLDLVYEAELLKDSHRLKQNLDKFNVALNNVEGKELESENVNELSLIQRAAHAGLEKHVQALLSKNVDPNQATKGTAPPLIIAAKRGFYKVIEVLKSHSLSSDFTSSPSADFTVVDKATKSTVLHAVLRRPTSDLALIKNGNRDYKKCLESLLDEGLSKDMKKIVNKMDESGNTALHYATQMWSGPIVRLLLENGANIGLANAFDELPINAIDKDVMEAFLNEYCLRAQGVPTSRDFKITIKYDFLAPPRHDDDEKVGNNKEEDEELASGPWVSVKSGWMHNDSEAAPQTTQHFRDPETEVLWHMSRSEYHRELLKHPVIASFLWLKWQRMSKFYNKNVLFFTLFVFSLTSLILLLYGGPALRGERQTLVNRCINKKDPLVKTGMEWPIESTLNWYITLVLLVILAIRELVQCAVGWWRYVFTKENWLEITLIVLTTILLTFDDNNEKQEDCENSVSSERLICAVIVVLAWSLLITVVGRHPQLGRYNIYTTMFVKVTTTFAKFLLGFSLFILAFALAFYVLLHKDSSEATDSDYPFFDDLGLSIVKTLGMFVGELEFADLPIDTSLGYIFFLLFVFLIVVVMMNLLNGLAVSDTGLIAQEAEIYALVSQVNLISYIESVILGDPFNFLSNWPKIFNRSPNCNLVKLYNLPLLRKVFHSLTGATGILLFYEHLPNKRVMVYPNRKSGLCTLANMCNKSNEEDEKNVELHPDLLESAKSAVLEQLGSVDSMEQRMERTEHNIERLLNTTTELSQQLQQLINRMS